MRDVAGFDECLDHYDDGIRRALRETSRAGYDVVFDNVGGALLDAALFNIAERARVVLCGSISTGYRPERPEVGLHYYQLLTTRRSRMEGFLVTDFADRFDDARRELMGWIADGSPRRPAGRPRGPGARPRVPPPPLLRRQPRQATAAPLTEIPFPRRIVTLTVTDPQENLRSGRSPGGSVGGAGDTRGGRHMTETAAAQDWGEDFDIFDPQYVRDPYPIWEDLRGQCPVAHSGRWGGSYLPTTHADVLAVAHDVGRFSSTRSRWRRSRPTTTRTATGSARSSAPTRRTTHRSGG